MSYLTSDFQIVLHKVPKGKSTAGKEVEATEGRAKDHLFNQCNWFSLFSLQQKGPLKKRFPALKKKNFFFYKFTYNSYLLFQRSIKGGICSPKIYPQFCYFPGEFLPLKKVSGKCSCKPPAWVPGVWTNGKIWGYTFLNFLSPLALELE